MDWQIRGTVAALMLVSSLISAGCTYHRDGPVLGHYQDFKVEAPRKNRVNVCHGYTCKIKTAFRFTEQDIDDLDKLMKKTRKDDSAGEERRAIAYAIGWMETRVGKEIGTDKDRPGMDFAASGDPTQIDCVDEATNTTSYLLVLERNNLLKHHTVGTPFAKDQLWRGVSGWTHWTAVIHEKASEQRWAVDSWIYENGENPAIVEVEKWYIEELENLPKATI